MLKNFIKRFSVITVIVCLLFTLCSTYVLAVDPVSAGAALASAMDAYGMAYGIGSVYDVANANGVTQSFDGLWDEFSLYQSNNGDSYNYQDYYDNFDNNPSIQAYSHHSGKFAGFYIDEESAEIFDKFWNWLLSGPAEMVKVDNAFQWNVDTNTGEIIEPVLSKSLTINATSVPNTTSNRYADWNNVGLSLGDYLPKAVVKGTQDVYVYVISGSSPHTFVFVSLSNDAHVKLGNGTGSNGWKTNLLTNHIDSSTGLYYAEYTGNNTSGNVNPVIPEHALSDVEYSVDTTKIKPRIVDNVTQPITIPDVASPDYNPTAKEIVTNIPWDNSFDDTDEDENGQPIPFPPSVVTPVVNDMINSIIDDGFAITVDPQPNPDPEPSPNEVFLPFIPVGLPSFNFSFSGIWHYVREWVSSLSAWFTTLFSIWNALPYAMIVPVYATAVVVIVLGVYKRFFM